MYPWLIIQTASHFFEDSQMKDIIITHVYHKKVDITHIKQNFSLLRYNGEGKIGLIDELQDQVLELGQRQFARGRLLWKGLLGKDAKCKVCCWWLYYLCYRTENTCFEKRRPNGSSRNALWVMPMPT